MGKHLADCELQIPDRHPLLCNHGARGTGKTVQLAISGSEFLRRRPDGFVVYLTFNDDFSELNPMVPGLALLLDPPLPMNMRSFEAGIARMILLRLMERFKGVFYKDFDPESQPEMKSYRDWVRSLPEVGVFKVLNMVREMLELPPTAPCMLAVDEIGKLQHSAACLSRLCLLLDSDADKKPRTFWLAVSSYGCLDLVKFATGSNRVLNMQPLPPIFPIALEEIGIVQMPLLVQLLHAKLTQPLLREKQDLVQRVNELLLISGGHPRRVEILLGYLDKLAPKKDNPTLAVLLAKMENGDTTMIPDLEKVTTSMNNMLNTSNVELEPGSFNDDLMRDLVVPYNFPTSPEEAKMMESSLELINEGLCSFLPVHPGSLRGRSFLAYPTLIAAAKNEKTAVPKQLGAALQRYVRDFEKDGQAFEKVICETLHAWATHNTSMRLRQLCATSVPGSANHESLLDMQLKPLPAGSSVDSSSVPLYPKEGVDLSQLACGVYYHSGAGNPFIDCTMILETTRGGAIKRVVVHLQFKDHYNSRDGLMAKWRFGQQFAYDDEVAMGPNTSRTRMGLASMYKDHGIAHVHLLVTANPITDLVTQEGTITPKGREPYKKGKNSQDYNAAISVEACKCEHLRENEGLVNLEDMKTWFPTMGWNLQAAHKLREVFFRTVDADAV